MNVLTNQHGKEMARGDVWECDADQLRTLAESMGVADQVTVVLSPLAVEKFTARVVGRSRIAKEVERQDRAAAAYYAAEVASR